ncbi:MAG: hypothetical protein IKX40_04710 [Thermoguttaceae bacterium]|nr:hypothetical protein [Thermoguttaceae bacterium]
MRINYNFPYFYNRLSSRQKARLAAEAAQNRPAIKMEGRTLTILSVQTSSLSHPKSDNGTEIPQGGLNKTK